MEVVLKVSLAIMILFLFQSCNENINNVKVEGDWEVCGLNELNYPFNIGKTLNCSKISLSDNYIQYPIYLDSFYSNYPNRWLRQIPYIINGNKMIVDNEVFILQRDSIFLKIIDSSGLVNLYKKVDRDFHELSFIKIEMVIYEYNHIPNKIIIKNDSIFTSYEQLKKKKAISIKNMEILYDLTKYIFPNKNCIEVNKGLLSGPKYILTIEYETSEKSCIITTHLKDELPYEFHELIRIIEFIANVG